MSGFIKSRTIFDNATSMSSQQGLRMLFSTEPPKPVVENEVCSNISNRPIVYYFVVGIIRRCW